MSKRKAGWKVIKTLTVEETREMRIRELRAAAEVHAELGADDWAAEYNRRAEALEAQRPPRP